MSKTRTVPTANGEVSFDVETCDYCGNQVVAEDAVGI